MYSSLIALETNNIQDTENVEMSIMTHALDVDFFMLISPCSVLFSLRFFFHEKVLCKENPKCAEGSKKYEIQRLKKN